MLLVCAVGACGGDDDPVLDGHGDTLIDAGVDAAPDAEPGDASAAPIRVGETDGVLDVPFRITAIGAGTDQIGAVDIGFNAGTIQIAGRTLDAVAYVNPPPFPGWDLYQVLAVATDALYVLWLYCNSSTSALEWIYWEGTDSYPLVAEPATGTCNGSVLATSTPVLLPALALPMPDLVQGFTITGAELSFDGTPGFLTEPTGDVTFLPFELVDCTIDCGVPGWWELHAVLWDSAAERVGFGIVYLLSSPPPIGISYEIWLPDLYAPEGFRQLDATWTMP